MKRKIAIVSIGLWAMAIGYALHALMVYKGTAGVIGQTPETWPENRLIAPSPDKPQLLMFAHPRCPCTKASLGELELLVARAHGRFEPAVLFYEPKDEAEAWSGTASVDFARSIPGVRVILDKRGDLAARFGAETSGHTVLYGSDGKLLFSGGITGSRGHLGENRGSASVLKLVGNASTSSSPTTTGVFGCEIFDRCASSHTTNPK